MSCNLTKYGVIHDMKQLKQILIPENQSEQELIRDDDWDNRWNWDTSEFMSESCGRTDSPNNQWLSQCLIGISPFADVMAFARNVYLAVYKQKQSETKSNAINNTNELQLTFETTLTGLEPNESITSLLLVPLVSQQKSCFGSIDWTAIIMGFSSGYLRIYAENGKLLLSQILHDEPIIDIKCHTFEPNSSHNNSNGDQLDELILLYQSAIVLIDGFTLYQSLRSCRNQLVKTHNSSNASNFGLTFMSNSMVDSLPFTYKKWNLQSSDRITDCDNAGISSRDLYDHLVSQSLYRGPYGVPKSVSPAANLLITVGENPFIGFYRAHEGASHTILNELTQAVFNKVKNMIPLSIFGSNKSNDENPKSKIESATPIPLRIGLFDRREGLKVYLSPNKLLAAVLDDFGRVILIDVDKWLAIRMWKGYRDAEVGWLEVDEDSCVTPNTKKALFLIIYAPKRGILEIWCSQMGPRVTAFNVGKSCKLIQCSYSMMGLNDILLQQSKSLTDFRKSRCFLLDYNSATVYNIEVPFLCALTDRNSKRTRDLHLFKELKNVLKQTPISCEKTVSIVLMLKTADVCRECLEEMTQIPELHIIKETASQLKNQLLSALKKNELDYENKLIAQMCSRILQICDLYESIEMLRKEEYNSFIGESSKLPDIQYLIDKLNWSGNDIARCLSLIAFRDSLISNKVTHFKHSTITISHLLSYFTIFSNHIVKSGDEEVYCNVPIEVKVATNDSLQKSHLLGLSDFIFGIAFQTNTIDLEKSLKNSCIVPSNLILLLFMSWLSSKYCDYWKCWEYFSDCLESVVEMMKHEIIEDDNYLLSPKWKEILEIVYESDNITASLVAVNMIKAVNSKSKQSNEPNAGLQNTEDMEWETLHIDNESLNIVIKQFEDLLLLDMLLRSNQKDNDLELKKISLAELMRSGPGIVSELVAKWAISSNITPHILNTLIDEETNVNESNDSNVEITVGEEAFKCENIDIETMTELLNHVRRCFPNCLEPDVLLVNCCWELLVQWDKEPSVQTEALKESLVYLNYVSSAVLKHNVACLLWKTFIQKRFETLAQIMEKMGRTPKDRICKKELEMSENGVESFMEYSCELLDFIMQSNMMAEIEPMPLFSIDDWWKSQSNSSQTMPLVILAVHQKIANAALVLEHSRLATAMFFITSFQLKSSRPLSLFPTVIRQYFFKDFHTFPVYSSNTDTTLSAVRIKFLLNVVSAIVQTLPVHNESEHDEEYILNQTKHYSQANKWFGKVITLSREWELNVDQIRRKYVSELYFYGCDSLAEEVMTSVVDLINLGSQMLSIAGIRVIHAINAKYGSLDQIHILPPNVLFWLKSLNVDSNCYSGSPLAATLAMLQHINNYVYSDKPNARICEALIDVVKTLDLHK